MLKVAGAPDPFEAASGNGGVGGNFQMLTGTSKRGMAGRRKVDLSSLKSGGTMAGGVAPGGRGEDSGGVRRIVADGLGGFTIATGPAAATAVVPTTVSSGGTPLLDLSGESPEMASPPEQEQQRGWTNNNKRLRVVGGGGRLGAAPVLPSAAATTAAADIPALYREAEACVIAGKKKKGGGGKGGAGVANGKKSSSQNIQQPIRGSAKWGGKTMAVSNGGGGGERSLDELMSGGLAATRR
ncbi:unnamed protein product [Ectocarpus sp. CCAP 1310/34]|nr:unnamed protein product [Ectocarpus sp. CCAP 1310/34]